MISINEAIEAGSWFEMSTENILIRIRPISFSKLDLTSVDNFNNSDLDVNSNLWLLTMELVNLEKKEIATYSVRQIIKVKDDEGYTFSHIYDSHLYLFSDFSKESGLITLQGNSGSVLNPKIRKVGALIFELPDDFDQLFLTVQDGEISEV